MIIEVWSDYVCPFCYIGKRRLEQALAVFPHKNEVKMVYRSYQLAPDAPKNPTSDIHELLAGKYGTTYKEAKNMNEQIGLQAKELGLTYRFDTMIHTNTFDAHRLAHYAAENGKAQQMTERLLQAYFTDSLHIGKLETLVRLAVEVGLEEQAVRDVLTSDQYSEHVKNDLQKGSQIGIQGVPFFVFNNKYAVSGAQPSETFLEILQKVWDEEQSSPNLTVLCTEKENRDPGCSDGSCTI